MDGRIREGSGAIDASMLTGESLPADTHPETPSPPAPSTPTATSIIETTAIGAETMLARIVRLVEDAQASKAPIQRLADRVSAVFVPVVLVIAARHPGRWLFAGAPPSAAILNAVVGRW